MDGAGSPSIDALLAQAHGALSAERVAQCCCGRPHCAYLAHNSAALEGLEKDLVSAAQIGQALLARHQSHLVESEAERTRVSSSIEQLENDKLALETDNAKKIEENRELLDRLEELNHQVSDSDAQVQSLTASLQATQQELQRLTVLTQRASSLEAQLLALESEHSQLQTELASTAEGKRSAMQRWRRAEATISELQSQVDQIEREAKEERERHVEVMNRMERTRAVERELDKAAGRLKSAAAATTIDRNSSGGQVVSHFVRDILQDNANLQSGVMELRELLLNSNAEVETLREQLQIHRPIEEAEGTVATLDTELRDHGAWTDQRASNAEGSSLHVHHHYHAPNITVRKQKKKRPSISSSQASGTSTPRATRIKDSRANNPSSFNTILSQTAASVPAGHQHRWSTQSTNSFSSFASSGPSSPRHTGSIFDTIEGATEQSQPTTPGSSLPGSPVLGPTDLTPRKPMPRSASGPLAIQLKSRPSLGELGSVHPFDPSRDSIGAGLASPAEPVTPFGTETIVEENEYAHNEGSSYLDELVVRPTLRRAASHESLLSVSGMDIHTLRDRPSQLLFGGPYSPLGSNTNSFGAEAATSHATARPAFNGLGSDGTAHARSLLNSVHARPGLASRPSLTQKVGGWVWGKWAVGPGTPSSESRGLLTPRSPPARQFGINQKGPIPGLVPPPPAPIEVETVRVDSDLLKESLGDMLLREDLGS